MEKKMVKQFSLTKLMIALVIALQISAVFADQKDYDTLHNMYESSDCSHDMGCSKILQALLANAIDNPQKNINKENDVIKKLTSHLDKYPFRDEDEEEDCKKSTEKAINLFKEMSIENKTYDTIYHLVLHIYKKINGTIIVTQAMIEKYA